MLSKKESICNGLGAWHLGSDPTGDHLGYWQDLVTANKLVHDNKMSLS